MTLAAVIARMGYDDITVHGFCSTFRDWAGETTPHAREVIETAMAHKLKDKAEAAYARGDLFAKRRKLMQDWADYLTAPLAEVVKPHETPAHREPAQRKEDDVETRSAGALPTLQRGLPSAG